MPLLRLEDEELLPALDELLGLENDGRLLLRDMLELLFARLPPKEPVLRFVLWGVLLRKLFIRSRLLLADPPRRPLPENDELLFIVLLPAMLLLLGVKVLRGF